MSTWLIYGAYGYTGRLIAEEARKRGHEPVLAGRDAARLEPLADRLGLRRIAFNLKDVDAIAQYLADIDLVLHAAGPFVQTAMPMILACLASKTHYLDITGEIPVFERTFQYHEAARARGVLLCSGVGFDVIPSDCLARYVAAQVPGAVRLETAVHADGQISAGTMKSGLEMIAAGALVRRGGKLRASAGDVSTRRVRFANGTVQTIVAPWGDVSTAYRSTGIPNITSYLSAPAATGPALGLVGALLSVGRGLLRLKPLRRWLQKRMESMFTGPDEAERESSRAYLWARAMDAAYHGAEAWLEITEPYRFTALASVRAVEQVLEAGPVGALTPAEALGTDFVLSVAGSARYDSPGDFPG